MNVLGLDLSLVSTGWARPNGESGVIVSSQKGMARIADIEALLTEVGLYRASLVVIEGYSFASKGRAIISLGELGGVIRYELFMDNTPFIDVPPTMVKKFASGRGNAKKDEMRLEVYKRWSVEFKTEHQVDAYVLAKIGEAVLSGQTENLIQPQRQVVELLLAEQAEPGGGKSSGKGKKATARPGTARPTV